MWREQAITEWSWHVNSIVACCHSAKLCPSYAAWDFWSQQFQGQGYQVGIFFKVKFQKFGLFKSGLAWKNGVWHVRHSLAFFGLFWWCWHEKTLFGLVFLKPLAKLLLPAWFSEVSSLFHHGPILKDTSGFAVWLTSQGKRHNAFFGKNIENYRTLYSVLSSRLCCFRKINTKVYANQVSCWKKNNKKQKYVHKQSKMESQRNAAYIKNKNKKST